jgi:glucosamine--fructose-6-phosphate aminotransferase (isomerizing)
MTAVAADMARQPAVLRALPAALRGELDRAGDLVARARAVRLLALGSSRHAAGYGAVALDVLAGVPAVVHPAVGRAAPAPAPHPADEVVAVSQSGATPALLEAVAAMRAGGVPIIAVVNEAGSPLAGLADVVLACRAGTEHTVAATASVTAQMLALRLLAGPVDAARIAALAEGAGACLRVVAPAVPPPAVVVAGGFAAEWVADEAALKLAEMAAVLPAAESVVDHLHGPVAVGARTLALLPADEPNTAALVASAGATTVGPAPAYDVVIPGTGDDSLDAILRVVAAQSLALSWAQRLGVDADNPRGLAKVTASL